MTQLQGIGQRACQIRATISEACAQSGRDPQEVLLIGVSKTVDVDAVEQAITAGIHESLLASTTPSPSSDGTSSAISNPASLIRWWEGRI